MTGPAVTSTRNRRVVAAAKLHRSRTRRETGRTLLEGPSLITEAARSGAAIEVVFAVPGDPTLESEAFDCEIVTVAPPVLHRIAGTDQPRGPVAEMAIPEPGALPDGHCVVLWGVGDPGNVGTIIRSAAAFGFSAIIGPETADPWSPKVLRAGAGGHFRGWVGTVPDPAPQFLAPRTHVAAVVAGGLTSLPEGPLALYVGDESSGLPGEVVAACDTKVTIPMTGGTESLNAAVAASILMRQAVT